MNEGPLSGLTLISFESRRAAEIAQLIAGYGGSTISAPSLREIPLAETDEVRELLERLEANAIDIVVLLTGVGTTALIEVLAPRCSNDRLRQLLHRPAVVARGPKPRAALRAIGVEADFTVPEPNTWREVLDTVEKCCGPLSGKAIAVQEYGRSNHELLAALGDRGAAVLSVPVYRWALPVDLGPLRNGVRTLAGGATEVAVFTSAQQCVHVLQIAADLGLEGQLRAAAPHVVFASIGPICSEALRAAGLPVDIEPTKPKMGPLIREIAERTPSLLERKRGRMAIH